MFLVSPPRFLLVKSVTPDSNFDRCPNVYPCRTLHLANREGCDTITYIIYDDPATPETVPRKDRAGSASLHSTSMVGKLTDETGTTGEAIATPERLQAAESVVRNVGRIVDFYLGGRLNTNCEIHYSCFRVEGRRHRMVTKWGDEVTYGSPKSVLVSKVDQLDLLSDKTRGPNTTPLPVSELNPEQVEQIRREVVVGHALWVFGDSPRYGGSRRVREAVAAVPLGLAERAYLAYCAERAPHVPGEKPTTVLEFTSGGKKAPLERACRKLTGILEQAVRLERSLYPIGDFPLPWGFEEAKKFRKDTGEGWKQIYPSERPSGYHASGQLTPTEVKAECIAAVLFLLSKFRGDPTLPMGVVTELQRLRSDPSIYERYYSRGGKAKAEELVQIGAQRAAIDREFNEVRDRLRGAKADGLRDRELRTGEGRARFGDDFNAYFSHILYEYYREAYVDRKRAIRSLPGPERDKAYKTLRRDLARLRETWRTPTSEKSEAEKRLEELEKKEESLMKKSRELRKKEEEGLEEYGIDIGKNRWGKALRACVMDSFFDLPAYETEIMRKLSAWIEQRLESIQ